LIGYVFIEVTLTTRTISGGNVMRTIPIVIFTVLILSIGMFSGCFDSPTNTGGTIGNQEEGNTTAPHQYYVVRYTSRTGFEGLNYVFSVDVVVQNIGNASGQARVWSQLNQGSNHYEKHQDIYLSAGESQSYTFRYTEYSFWSTDAGSYQVWVDNS
jgi:hypothetical protein